MKILIFCWGNSAYIKRHIENVCIPNNIDVTIYTDPINNEKLLEYYNKKNVKVISNKNGSGLLYNIPKIGGLITIIRDIRKIKKGGPYDFLHVHGVTKHRILISGMLKRQYEKLIVSFWGSDVFNPDWEHKKLKKILDSSTVITLSTKEMRERFTYFLGEQYNDRITMINFPTTVLNAIEKNIQLHSESSIKRDLEVPEDKVIIVCGYNASQRQQHLIQLEQLNKLEKKIKESIFLIIPMMYGGEEKYIKTVNSKLNDIDIEGRLITTYLNESEIAKLWISADVFIHTQPTDGFSSSLRENLYAGTVVINGKWLDYDLLDKNGIHIIKLKEMNDINSVFFDVYSQIDYHKKKSRKNKSIILSISSPAKEYEKWKNLYF